jgi:hypothetical protein
MQPTYRQLAEVEKHLIPKEFWEMMESQAWERGHSSGQQEVDLILMNLVNDFAEATIRYIERTNNTLV